MVPVHTPPLEARIDAIAKATRHAADFGVDLDEPPFGRVPEGRLGIELEAEAEGLNAVYRRLWDQP